MDNADTNKAKNNAKSISLGLRQNIKPIFYSKSSDRRNIQTIRKRRLLFIKNQVIIREDDASGVQIDLRKIKIPFVNIIASKDELVAPESNKALNNAIGSSDKSILEFNSGHVGSCIGSRTHKELWPKVGEWLKGIFKDVALNCMLFVKTIQCMKPLIVDDPLLL